MIEETREDAARQLARESVLEAVADAEAVEVWRRGAARGPRAGGRARADEAAEAARAPAGSGRDVPLRRDLRLRKALDLLTESAQPIDADTAQAREKIWTPDKQRKEEGSAQLWTPGSKTPPGEPEGG